MTPRRHPTEQEKAAVVAADKRRAASDRKIAEMTVDAWIATHADETIEGSAPATCPHEAAEQHFGEKDWRCIKCGAVVTLPRNA